MLCIVFSTWNFILANCCKKSSSLVNVQCQILYACIYIYIYSFTLLLKHVDKVSHKAYYEYRPFQRKGHFDVRHGGNTLFQQWCVDMYCKVLAWQLNWAKISQTKLRAELYQDMYDAKEQQEDIDPSQLGRKVILPATFYYTPRCYKERYQDAMAIISKYKKPDLFITFTCNPHWKEIEDELYPGQTALDNPTLTSRVFHQKLQELLHDITDKGALGRVVANVHTVEFQKRGLPHAHILIIFDHQSKLHTADDFDKIVCAELPDPIKEPDLFKLVTKFMIHTPCGKRSKQPCMVKGYCKACYPKDFQQFTQATDDGYPLYRRRSPRCGGFQARMRIKRKQWL